MRSTGGRCPLELDASAAFPGRLRTCISAETAAIHHASSARLNAVTGCTVSSQNQSAFDVHRGAANQAAMSQAIKTATMVVSFISESHPPNLVHDDARMDQGSSRRGRR